MAAQLMLVIVWWCLWLMPSPSDVKLWRFIYYKILVALLLYGGVGTLGDWYNQKYPIKRVIETSLAHLGPDIKYAASGKVEKNDVVRVIWVGCQQLV
jgi:hypothetical protein